MRIRNTDKKKLTLANKRIALDPDSYSMAFCIKIRINNILKRVKNEFELKKSIKKIRRYKIQMKERYFQDHFCNDSADVKKYGSVKT